MQREPEHPLQGPLRQNDGSVVWRVWAPCSQNVRLAAFLSSGRRDIGMERLDDGYFACRLPETAEGLSYAYVLDDGREYPDPASRWQPNGVHRPSAVFFPETFPWSDADWRGVAKESLVIYELHVGTFTPEGTFDAIAPRLPQLADLGVTAIELMPVAQFPGDRNWGYDGVHPYAVQNSYGGPRALQRLVDAAHRRGLAVILDVVYNHLGPEGNYLGKFGPYFTDRYHTPWGNAINFDGPESDAVRAVFHSTTPARGSATSTSTASASTPYSRSTTSAPPHPGRHSAKRSRRRPPAPPAWCTSLPRATRTTSGWCSPRQRGGLRDWTACGRTTSTTAVHALLTGQRAGYYMDYGRPAQLAKAIRRRVRLRRLLQPASPPSLRQPGGQNRAHRVSSSACRTTTRWATTATGTAWPTLLSPPARRLVCGLLLLSPCTPLLFMGEEYGEDRPFPFFCSFERAQAGRGGAAGTSQGRGVDVDCRAGGNPRSTERGNLRRGETELGVAAGDGPRRVCDCSIGDLLAARRRWPALADHRPASARLVDSRKRAGPTASRPCWPSRGAAATDCSSWGEFRRAGPLPPSELDRRPVCCLSTEAVRYGGQRRAGQPTDGLLPYELMVFDRSGGRP